MLRSSVDKLGDIFHGNYLCNMDEFLVDLYKLGGLSVSALTVGRWLGGYQSPSNENLERIETFLQNFAVRGAGKEEQEEEAGFDADMVREDFEEWCQQYDLDVIQATLRCCEIDVTDETINRWLEGTQSPSVKNLKKIFGMLKDEGWYEEGAEDVEEGDEVEFIDRPFCHTLWLRPDFQAEITLPGDLTEGEVDRLVTWLRQLRF